jgi:hypothetical protein
MKIIPVSRRRHYVAIFSVFLITAALIAGMTGCNGDGYSQDLEIRTWYDLNDVRHNLEGHHTLMNDLDSTTAGYEELASPTANEGKGWEPLGPKFTGIFDGQGHEIRDLFINWLDETCVGLFGWVDEGGRIENIGVVSAIVTGNVGVGGLVGYNRGTVSNCYFTGNVTGNWSVGGLVGDNQYGTLSNSYYNYDEVLINGEKIITIGALFGEDFNQWLANDKFLDINERLSQENGYYLINDVSDFKELLAFGQDASLKFRLNNDIDLATEPNFYIPYLAGEFDGNGHKISNLSFNFGFVNHVGLFGYLDYDGKVTRVGVRNVNITGYHELGGLVGSISGGTVINCYATGNVTGEERVGGLVGENDGIVNNSYSTGSVHGSDNGFGGLVGYSSGTVSNSYSTGSVYGGNAAGGLVGASSGTVSNSHSTGNVTGEDTVGGLAGGNYGTVSSSYSTSSVTGHYNVGGLVGFNGGDVIVSNSHSTGNVTGNSFVGGLVGNNWGGTVNDSYSTGSVYGNAIDYITVSGVGVLVGVNYGGTVSNSYSTGSATGNERIGGLVGVNTWDGTVSNSYSSANVTAWSGVGGLVGINEEGTVSNSYSTGSVTGNLSVGGLVGLNEDTVNDSFWDTVTSGQATSDGGTGKNTTEMQNIITFSGAAWDIVEVGGSSDRNPAYIWNIVDSTTYPFLSWQS